MRLLYWFFYFLFFYIRIIFAYEYIYPIASLYDGESILYIHQHSITNLELFKWDIKTNHKEQILWSIFNPAGLLLLPDNSGFSFIDNGRLKIKLFQKRSPKAIDFDEPLFNINALTWIDAHTCYCSAKQNNNFALFQLQDNGTAQCLLSGDDKDYMYPQKINEDLFYIERYTLQDISGVLYYKVMTSSYEHYDYRIKPTELIFDFENTPIIFLTMISETKGFVLSHAQNVDDNNPTILFTYYQIIKQNNAWYKNILFYFEISTNLLLKNEHQLYESLLPLLPRIVNDKVYFVDCSKNNSHYLEPYVYDTATAITKKITLPIKKQGHCFTPLLCGKNFYCGGTLDITQKDPFVYFLT
jgi:hypothetical protein